MVEALTVLPSSQIMKKPDVAMKLHEVYKELINSIPNDRFGDFGMKTKMLSGYYCAKTKSPVAGVLLESC